MKPIMSTDDVPKKPAPLAALGVRGRTVPHKPSKDPTQIPKESDSESGVFLLYTLVEVARGARTNSGSGCLLALPSLGKRL